MPENRNQRQIMATLLDKADMQGYLSTQDIAAVIGDDMLSETRDIILSLKTSGVRIIIPDDLPETGDAFFIDEENPEDIDLRIDLDPVFDLSSIAPDDAIGLYLKEMAQVPLLSIEDEIELARRYEEGKRAETVLNENQSLLTIDEEQALLETLEIGLQAREHLIKANTRLVVSIAKKYMGQGVPFLDLIQEGNLGLMKAVEKFEYRLGYRFSTYATWWIRQTISRSIAYQGRTIRVPVHMSDKIRRLNKVAHQLEQENGREPTLEELAGLMEEDPDRIQWMQQINLQPLSLEHPIGEEDDNELGVFIEDKKSPTPSQIVQDAQLREKLEELLTTLTPREARILRLRFGLSNGVTYTLEEVGEKFGLTRERIRQIEGRALRRLRHPSRSRQLKDFLSRL